NQFLVAAFSDGSLGLLTRQGVVIREQPGYFSNGAVALQALQNGPNLDVFVTSQDSSVPAIVPFVGFQANVPNLPGVTGVSAPVPPSAGDLAPVTTVFVPATADGVAPELVTGGVVEVRFADGSVVFLSVAGGMVGSEGDFAGFDDQANPLQVLRDGNE